MFCPTCGSEINDRQNFCPACGRPVAVEESENSPRETTSPQPRIHKFIQTIGFSNYKKFLLPAITVAVLIIAVIVVAVFHSSAPSRAQIRDDLTEYLALQQDANDGFEIAKLTKDEQKLDSSKKFALITCTVTLENDCVRRAQSYQLSYRKLGRSDWVIYDVSPYNYESWTAEPFSGVTERVVQAKLLDRVVKIDGSEITLDGNNLVGVSIDSQTTDLNTRTDQLEITYQVQSNVASCSQKADISFVFGDNDWMLYDLKNAGDAEITFTEGHTFERTDEQIKNDIYTTPIVWKGNYGTQNISIDENTMSNFSVKSQTFEWASNQVTVSCAFTVVKRIATLQVDADVIYTNSASGWNVSAINYIPVVESISLKGNWVGYYSTWGKKPSLTLSVTSHDANNMLAATFSFGPSANAPDYESGSFSMVGGVEKDTLSVNLKGNEWIDKSGSFSMIDLYGMLWIDDERIADKNSGFEITLKQIDEG